ncbi:MAG: hypothetical protein V1813_03540 [Candidatus Aenigmatarchaeota archaeon]
MLGLDFVSLEYFLPFLLVVAIVYGALETAGMFRSKGVKVIIAVVLGFFSVMSYQVVQMINSFLPFAAIVFVFIFIAGYMKKSLSGKQGQEKDNTLIIIVFGLGILFIASIANSTGGFSLYQYTDFLWLIGVVAVVAILYAAYKMGSQ